MVMCRSDVHNFLAFNIQCTLHACPIAYSTFHSTKSLNINTPTHHVLFALVLSRQPLVSKENAQKSKHNNNDFQNSSTTAARLPE